MKKTITLFATIFLLIFSSLSFAQTENPYQDFNPEQLKSNKDYVKNFAPNNFRHSILYNCFQDMVSAARAQYAFCPAMKTDIRLDSTATMQAEYQASKEEKTIENLAPYRTTEQRLRKYGLGTRGVELASKAKATLGSAEYTYYDVCLELVRPLLKNLKTAAVLLDRQYTYLGFGYEFDKYMKNVYVSLILANDRTFNEGKVIGIVKDLPYTRSKMGLQGYDEQLCRKCMTDKNLELLSECLSVKDNTVYFSHDDFKALRRIIGKEGDAIVLDFVQHDQYKCDEKDQVDQDRPNHGFMTKIITYEQMLSDNQAPGKKTSKLLAPIATVPEEIPEDAEYDINIIIVKDGKFVCRDVVKKSVEYKNAAYKEKMFFLKDEISIKPAGQWVPAPEQHTIEVVIPFEDKKLDYTAADLAPFLNGINEPAFTIDKIEVVATNSLNFLGDATSQKNQKRRAESIAKALKTHYANPNLPTTISYDDSWELFKKDVVYDEVYYDLTLMTKQEAANALKADGGKIAKILETNYLKKHRFAKLVMTITYKVDEENEQDFVVTKFNRTVAAKNWGLAMSIQQYMMKQVEAKKYNIRAVVGQEIPVRKECQALLINRAYMQNVVEGDLTDRCAQSMIEACKLNVTTPVAQFNKVTAEVAAAVPIADNVDLTNRQAAIDKLYTIAQLPQDQVNNLNMEFQFQVLDYLKKQPATTENVTLADNTYTKIKTIRNPKMSSWQNAYKLASVFAQNGDYVYAVSLMEPFLDEPKISNDFLFSFISLAAVREEMYMSGNFAKAVKMASEKDPTRLCNLFDKLPVVIFDNQEVQTVICKTCK